MLGISFYKYHGTGNDFVLMAGDNFPGYLDKETIRTLCKRHVGVGADGLIFLEKRSEPDFYMHYFNSDGRKSSMCGNGGRCAVALAARLGWIEKECRFSAIDGLHHALILDDGRISLGMNDVTNIIRTELAWLLDTGSPHYVREKEGIAEMDLVKEAKAIRYNPQFQDEGINVNFIEWSNARLHVRTYERGVEDETLSCGTGVCASAIVWSFISEKNTGEVVVPLATRGGELEVAFTRTSTGEVTNIRLIGPAAAVFTGVWSLED